MIVSYQCKYVFCNIHIFAPGNMLNISLCHINTIRSPGRQQDKNSAGPPHPEGQMDGIAMHYTSWENICNTWPLASHTCWVTPATLGSLFVYNTQWNRALVI